MGYWFPGTVPVPSTALLSSSIAVYLCQSLWLFCFCETFFFLFCSMHTINYSSVQVLTTNPKEWEALPRSFYVRPNLSVMWGEEDAPNHDCLLGPFYPSENWSLLNSLEDPRGLAAYIKNESPSCLRAVQAVNTKEKNDLLSVSHWIHYLEGPCLMLHQNIIVLVIQRREGEGIFKRFQRKCCRTISATGQAKYDTSQKMRAAEKLICSSL